MCWFHCRYSILYLGPDRAVTHASDESQESSFTFAPLNVCLDWTGAVLMQSTHQLHCDCLYWPQLSRESLPAVAADLHSEEVRLIGEKWRRVRVGVQTAVTFKRSTNRKTWKTDDRTFHSNKFFILLLQRVTIGSDKIDFSATSAKNKIPLRCI